MEKVGPEPEVVIEMLYCLSLLKLKLTSKPLSFNAFVVSVIPST